jgi:hypothetical protein
VTGQTGPLLRIPLIPPVEADLVIARGEAYNPPLAVRWQPVARPAVNRRRRDPKNLGPVDFSLLTN